MAYQQQGPCHAKSKLWKGKANKNKTTSSLKRNWKNAQGYVNKHTASMRSCYPYEIEQRKGSYFPILGYVVVRKLGSEFSKTFALFHKLRLNSWRPLKQTKTKNKRHFFIPTFKVIQLCFFAQNDSFTLKVLKSQFVFGWAMIREIADWMCNVSNHGSAKDKLRF